MQLHLANPHHHFPSLEVDEILVPTLQSGEIMILPGHARLVSQLGAGTITYHSRSGNKSLAIQEGLVEVHGDEVIILYEEPSELKSQL